MSQIVHRVQFQVKKSSNDFLTYLFRVFTGGWLGLVFSHIFQILMGYSDLMFLFVIVITTGIVVRMTKNRGWISILILNLICVLMGIVLKMYIDMAPGI